jgi:hypothetical protein
VVAWKRLWWPAKFICLAEVLSDEPPAAIASFRTSRTIGNKDATRSELQVFCFSGRVDAGAKCDFANVDTPPAIALIKKCVFNGVFFAAKASNQIGLIKSIAQGFGTNGFDQPVIVQRVGLGEVHSTEPPWIVECNARAVGHVKHPT